MTNLTPIQIILLGLLQIGIGIAILLFAPIHIHVIAWILILFGSMTIFLAIYIWFNVMITKASRKNSE